MDPQLEQLFKPLYSHHCNMNTLNTIMGELTVFLEMDLADLRKRELFEWAESRDTQLFDLEDTRGQINNLKQVVECVLVCSFREDTSGLLWTASMIIENENCFIDLHPDLQDLSSAIDDRFQDHRLKARAASALINCVPEILTPLLDEMVSKLLPLLQDSIQRVQEATVHALASLADLLPEQFKKCYDTLMPYLKETLVNAEANCKLRFEAMRLIGHVAVSVGKDKSRDDAKQVMEVLVALQGAQMLIHYPTSYLHRAWSRLCKCLGQDFLPYMAVVMPPLLQSAQLIPDVITTSAGSDNEYESDDESMETLTFGDNSIRIQTSVLEEIDTTCNVLCCFLYELKDSFFPWIDQVAPILVAFLKILVIPGFPTRDSSLKFYHHEVRKQAIQDMPGFLLSSKVAIEKGHAQGRDGTHLKQLSDYIVPALVEALNKEPNTEIIADILDALSECIQISGLLLDENQVRSIVDEIKQVISGSSSRKGERVETIKAGNFASWLGEPSKEETEKEEVFTQVAKVLRTLVTVLKASFFPFFEEMLSYLMGADKTAEERRIAICIFDDVAEQCREAALRYYDTYLPFLLEACNDENSDVQQAAVYGLGVCAEHGGSVIKPRIGEVLSSLDAVIRRYPLHPDNVMAYDAAVSALGKVCHFQRDGINAAQVIPAWLKCLPIKGDVNEAKAVHELLTVMVERSDAELLGHHNQNLPEIVAVFVKILCAGKDIATDQTISRIRDLLKHNFGWDVSLVKNIQQPWTGR